MRRARTFCTLALAACALLEGCSNNEATSSTCTPDPALIGAHRECRADDQCPCGSHCGLGQCIAECGQGTECASGQRCDSFGRCRGDSAKTPPVDPSQLASKIALESAEVKLAPGAASAVRFRGERGALGPIRALARSGFELQCTGGTAWKVECLEDGLAAGVEMSLPVRLAPGSDPATIGSVLVFSGSHVASVSVRGPSAPPVMALSAGSYAGTATLVSLGVTPAPSISIPISARIFTGERIFALTDPMHALNQAGEWIGRITTDNGATGTLSFPRALVESIALTATAKAEILATVPSAEFTSTAGKSFVGSIRVDYTGVLGHDRTPTAMWQLALTRRGDLPAGTAAPAVPADAVSSLPVNAETTPSDWSQSLSALFVPVSAGSPEAVRNQVLVTWQATSGTPSTPRRLDACTPGGRTVGASLLGTDEWPTHTFAPAVPISPSAIDPGERAAKNALVGAALGAVTAKYVRGASASQVAIAAGQGAIPCAMTYEPTLLYCYDGTPNTAAIQMASIDRCAEIANELHCNVESGSGKLEYQLRLDTTNDILTTPCASTTTPVVANVTKVCTLPPVGWNCGELVSCVQGDGISSTSPGSTPLSVGGDLSCGGGPQYIATVAEAKRNQPANTDTVTAVVKGTLADLTRLRQPAAAPFPAALGFDAARTLVALEYATEVDRQRAGGASLPPSAGATRYANRLLQQWMGAHALVASEATQRAQILDAVQGTVADPAFPGPRDALKTSLDGWALVFHPRFANALSSMDGAVLGSPDYRADWLGAAPADTLNPQRDGFPVAMLDTLRAQVALLDAVLYRASLESDATALAMAGRAVRDAIVVQALARDAHARVQVAAPNAPWLAKFGVADAAFTAALGTALSRATRLYEGRNPLGIEDEDLPLYFSGASVDPGGRFSAISDYLLGAGAPASGTAWAPQAVAEAESAANALNAAYKESIQRQYEGALSVTASQDRVDAIKSDYGERLAGICGLPQGIVAGDALDKWPGFDADRCYFASEAPACKVDEAQVDALLDAPTVLYQACVAKNVALASPSVSYIEPEMNQVLAVLAHDPATVCTYGTEACASPGSARCLRCGAARTGPLRVAALASLNLSQVSSDVLARAQQICRAEQPGARQSLPTVADGPQSPLARPECYRGSLGDLAFSLRGAAKDLEIARSQYQDHLDAYDIEVRNCTIKSESNDKLDALRRSHDESMQDMRHQKAELDQIAAIADGVYKCASITATAASASSPWGQAIAGGSAAVGCGAAVIEAAANYESIGLQTSMDDAEARYQSMVSTIEEQTDVKLCLNEAHQQLVGIRTANQQIERALIDFGHAQYAMQSATADARRAYDEGRAEVAIAEGRAVRPPALDAWVDGRVASFTRAMRQARLVSYLAERAVEYEFQASLAARGRILTAQTPAELSAALSELRSTSGTLGIGGRRPSQLKVVISMRDHLLQLADATNVAKGEQSLSPTERFKLLLRDPRFAVFANGVYAGQRVPFSIAPLGALHGDTKGIPIFATTDCAERIWSVNASISSATPLVRGAQTSFARVDLLKSNTFFSQKCDAGPTTRDPFQLGSVRPSRNLFRDPEFGLAGPATAGAGDPNVPSEVTQDTRARMQAYFNVSREKMEEDAYANGETSELAARGLYGDYALFFPAGILSLPRYDTKGVVTGYTDGLDLGAIDDILLRIDYVSVAR
jgi:hypothetical protein